MSRTERLACFDRGRPIADPAQASGAFFVHEGSAALEIGGGTIHVVAPCLVLTKVDGIITSNAHLWSLPPV